MGEYDGGGVGEGEGEGEREGILCVIFAGPVMITAYSPSGNGGI